RSVVAHETETGDAVTATVPRAFKATACLVSMLCTLSSSQRVGQRQVGLFVAAQLRLRRGGSPGMVPRGERAEQWALDVNGRVLACHVGAENVAGARDGADRAGHLLQRQVAYLPVRHR